MASFSTTYGALTSNPVRTQLYLIRGANQPAFSQFIRSDPRHAGLGTAYTRPGQRGTTQTNRPRPRHV